MLVIFDLLLYSSKNILLFLDLIYSLTRLVRYLACLLLIFGMHTRYQLLYLIYKSQRCPFNLRITLFLFEDYSLKMAKCNLFKFLIVVNGIS
jgi:hypothetical protein